MKRTIPLSEFEELGEAVEELKKALIKITRIEKAVAWLAALLRKWRR